MDSQFSDRIDRHAPAQANDVHDNSWSAELASPLGGKIDNLRNNLAIILAGASLLLGSCSSPKNSGSFPETPQNGAQVSTMSDDKATMIIMDPLTRGVEQKEYILDGGGSVVVHQPFGNTIYSAFVTMPENGIYPGPNSIAKDVNRTEFIYVTDGKFTITVNDKPYVVEAGKNLLIQNGDTYSITGSGHCLVLVQDGKGGKTEILPQK